LAAGLVLAFSIAPGVAAAAVPTPAAKPRPAPTAVQILGQGITGKIVVPKDTKPQLFQRLLVEVSWLARATPQASAPRADALGPKYTVTLLVRNAPQQIYELYPLATGGPRAHRPAGQPTGRTTDGWFYGRQTMQESLRLGGAPLKQKLDVVSGGVGGGVGGDEIQSADADPSVAVNSFLTEMRNLLLLNGAVLVVILFGLGGTAYLVRRKV